MSPSPDCEVPMMSPMTGLIALPTTDLEALVLRFKIRPIRLPSRAVEARPLSRRCVVVWRTGGLQGQGGDDTTAVKVAERTA